MTTRQGRLSRSAILCQFLSRLPPFLLVPPLRRFCRSTVGEYLQQEEGRVAWEAAFCTEYLSAVSGDPEEAVQRLANAADKLRRGGEGKAFATELLSSGGVQTAVSDANKGRSRCGSC